MSKMKATEAQIREIEKQGLTLVRSAFLLGIHRTTLMTRIKRMNLEWRGKGKSFMDYIHEKNITDSTG